MRRCCSSETPIATKKMMIPRDENSPTTIRQTSIYPNPIPFFHPTTSQISHNAHRGVVPDHRSAALLLLALLYAQCFWSYLSHPRQSTAFSIGPVAARPVMENTRRDRLQSRNRTCLLPWSPTILREEARSSKPGLPRTPLCAPTSPTAFQRVCQVCGSTLSTAILYAVLRRIRARSSVATDTPTPMASPWTAIYRKKRTELFSIYR